MRILTDLQACQTASRRRVPRRDGGSAAQAEAVHGRQAQPALAQAGAIGLPAKCRGRDVAIGVCAFVAEARRVRRTADAEGIQHEEEGARHDRYPRKVAHT